MPHDTSEYDRWSLGVDERPVAELRELAAAVAGRRRTAGGDLRPISANGLLDLRRRMASQFPERFGPPVPTPDAVLVRHLDPRVRQLADRLADANVDAGLRAEAAAALGRLKDPAGQKALVAALRSPIVEVRRSAAAALGEIEPLGADTVHVLVGVLQHDADEAARANAARALHGPAAKAATVELLQALKGDRGAGVREAAAFALRGAAVSPELLTALRAAFADVQSWRVRVEAAMSVATLVPNDQESITVLTSALAGNDWWGVELAARYLDELGPRAGPAAAALAKLVQQGNYQPHMIDKTWHALHALAKIGPAAKPALSALIAKLGQDSANPHWYNPATNYVQPNENMIAYTLARIGPDAVPELRRVFREDKDAKRRRAAVLALGFLGPPAKAAVADLEAEAKKLAEQTNRNNDEEWLATALEKALARIRDPKAMPVDKLQ
jgi:HEAT repeat protein